MVQWLKNLPTKAGDVGSIPESSWRRKWQPTPVLLPGESHDMGTWKADRGAWKADRGAWKAIVHRVAKTQT